MRVLLIDDEPQILKMLTKGLELEGYQVTTASDGQEGLDRIFENKVVFGAVVTDIKMPKLDGTEFAEKLFLSGLSIPLIFITGNKNLSLNIKHSYLGVLYKPFKIEELLDILKIADNLINESNVVH